MSTRKEIGGDMLEGRGRISSFPPLCAVPQGNCRWACLSDHLYFRLISQELCLRLWPKCTFISCFPPLLPPSSFTPSETAAFRLIVKLGFHSFLFWALFMGVGRGVAAELNLGNREEKCEPVGWVPHVMCSALLCSPGCCTGASVGRWGRQLKGGSLAPAPKLTTSVTEGTWAPACIAPGTAAVPASASTAGVKIWSSVALEAHPEVLLRAGLSRAEQCPACTHEVIDLLINCRSMLVYLAFIFPLSKGSVNMSCPPDDLYCATHYFFVVVFSLEVLGIPQ